MRLKPLEYSAASLLEWEFQPQITQISRIGEGKVLPVDRFVPVNSCPAVIGRLLASTICEICEIFG
jgi:hypothetical protein